MPVEPPKEFHFRFLHLGGRTIKQSSQKNIILFSLLVIFLFFIHPSSDALAGTASLSWDANTEPDLGRYNVYFGTSSGNYGPAENVGITTSHTLAGLSAGTYFFAVTALDISGNESGFSNEVIKIISSTTPTPPGPTPPVPDTTPPSISSIVAGSISTSTATITWITNEAATAEVKYGTISGSYPLQSPTTADTTTGSGPHSVNLSSLTANTTYFFKVVSRDARGNSSQSIEGFFKTLIVRDTFPPEITAGPTVSGRTATSAIITWSTSEGASSLVNYGTTIDYGSTSNSISPVISHSQRLSGLTPETSYHYQVRSRDAAGNDSLPSADGTFTTTASSGLLITSLNVGSGLPYKIVNNGLSNGATIYIDRGFTFESLPALLNGATYIKTANNDKNSTGSAFLTFNVSEGVTVYIAHDDRISVKPSWLLSAFTDTGDNVIIASTAHSLFKKIFSAGPVSLGGNQEGNGSSSTSMYVVMIEATSTAPSNPNPPELTAFEIGLITETGATIKWVSNEVATSRVEFRSGIDSPWISTSLSEKFVIDHRQTLTGLSPSKAYQYHVISRNVFGKSTTSPDFVFRTKDAPVIPGPPFLSLIDAVEVTDRTARIIWGTRDFSTTRVIFGETPSFGKTTVENEATSTSHSETLSGLKARTRYYYMVVSIDQSGKEFVSNDKVRFFTTKAASSGSPVDTSPPEDVVNFSVRPGLRKLLLNWTNPLDADFQGVRIYYRTDRPPTSLEDGVFLGDFMGAPGQAMSSTHVGLKNNVTYFYAAASFDGHQNFQNTAQSNAKTFNPGSNQARSEDEPFSTGGCGMIKPGNGGEPPGPGQAAAMIGMLGVILFSLLKKMVRAGRVQIIKI